MMNAQETADMTNICWNVSLKIATQMVSSIQNSSVCVPTSEFWEELGKAQHCKGCSCFEKPVDTELTIDEQLEYLRQKLTRGDLYEQD